MITRRETASHLALTCSSCEMITVRLKFWSCNCYFFPTWCLGWDFNLTRIDAWSYSYISNKETVNFVLSEQ